MKNKIRFKPRNTSSALRLTRHLAVNDRRRRLSLWQFYQGETGAEAQPRVPDAVLTEPSSR